MTTTTFITDHQLHSYKTRGKKSYQFSQIIYQVEVYGEEGDCISFEIMADNAAQATAMAEEMATAEMVDISYIQINVMG